MQGYVARKGDRYYAVIYEGIDPITGLNDAVDIPPAPTATTPNARRRPRPSPARRRPRTVVAHRAVYLTQRWLPSKKLTLRASTYDSYSRNIDLHITPAIGRVPLRRLRPDHLERLYAELADHGRADGTGGLNPKTIVEIHMILRRSLDDAARRGLIVSNPATRAKPHRSRALRRQRTRRPSGCASAGDGSRAAAWEGQ